MAADDARHGSPAGAGVHYKEGSVLCPPCREARRTWYRRYTKEVRANFVRTINAGHGGVWARVDSAKHRGFTYADIGAQVGLVEAHLSAVHHAGPAGMVRVATWRALNQLNVSALGPSNVGTLRRLQALHTLGWTIKAVTDLAGIQTEVGKRALRGEHTSFQLPTRVKIADVYEQLSMRLPEPSANTTRALRRSQREGWLPPLAWDDVDDPGEDPRQGSNHRRGTDVDHAVIERLLSGERVRCTRAEKEEVTRRWVRSGRSLNELERLHGWAAGRYGKTSVTLQEAS